MIAKILMSLGIVYLAIGLSLATLLLGLGLFNPPPPERDARPEWMRGPVEDEIFAFYYITVFWPKLRFNNE